MLTKLYVKALVAKTMLAEKLKSEKGEVNIVAIVILIGIAVLLAVFFKDAIGNLLKTLFATINGKANEALVTPVNPGG